MFGAFVVCALSIYVPFKKTRFSPLPYKSPIGKYIKEHSNVVVLIPKPSYELAKEFLAAQPLFPEASFYTAVDEIMEEYLNQKIETPCLAFFKDGELIGMSDPVSNEMSMLYTIDLFLKGKRPILNEQFEFVAALGGAPITIGSRANLTDHLVHLAKDIGHEIGSINVINLSDSLAESIDLKPNNCIIYRKTDKTLKSFNCTMEGLKQFSYPYVSRVDKSVLMRNDKTSVILITPSFNQHQYDFLYEFGKKYPDFSFIYVRSSDRDIIKEFTSDYYDTTSYYLEILNYKNGYRYDYSEILDKELIRNDFNDTLLNESLTQILNKIRNSELKKTYRSERFSSYQNFNRPIKKVVGLTYHDFIDDTEKDTVLFFVSLSTKSKEYFSKVYKTADNLKSENKTEHIKFGMIIPELNFVEGGFPSLPKLPFAYLYPANSSAVIPVLGDSSEDVLLSLEVYGTYQHELGATLPSDEEFHEIEEETKKFIPKMKPEEAKTMNEVLENLRKMITSKTNDEL
ncbi:protein disulfide isomerase [Histomonas meleagridis]|uniref:protein disulfide isomerase n=1 Tax=Histomonas meleagridis TaxID=135588 RepID=UPI003559E477|nr:protein disulfide isomerase [Histomonas meleagridis]KAH0797456.1 protein disulfide isomerase [Histomonas meleagridis]